MVSVLGDVMRYFEDIGVYEVALPFLLIFTLVFAILQKSKILGEKAKNFNVVIALVVGILFIRNTQLVALVNRLLPNVAMFIVIFLMLLLLLAIFMKESAYEGWGNQLMALAGVFSVIAIIWSLSVDYVNQRYLLPQWLTGLDSRTKVLIVVVAISVLLIWLLTKEESDKGFTHYTSEFGKQLRGEG